MSGRLRPPSTFYHLNLITLQKWKCISVIEITNICGTVSKYKSWLFLAWISNHAFWSPFGTNQVSIEQYLSLWKLRTWSPQSTPVIAILDSLYTKLTSFSQTFMTFIPLTTCSTTKSIKFESDSRNSGIPSKKSDFTGQYF